MRATKTQSKPAGKTVGTSAPIPAKATGLRKTISSQAPRKPKSTSVSKNATSRSALTAASPKTTPVAAESALARLRIANWRADDADWAELQVDRHRPAWHLAALAFGLKPIEDIEMRLQAARRVEEKKAYGDLIRALQNNLTRVDDANRLQYVHDDVNNDITNDLAKRKIDQFVDVAKFVRFVESRNIIVNERLWGIANRFAEVEQPTRPAVYTARAMVAGNLVPKPSTLDITESTSSSENGGKPLLPVEVGTLARILIALAIHHYDFKPDKYMNSDHVKKAGGGTYAPILRICQELKFIRPNDWGTVKNVLVKSSELIGDIEMRYAVNRHQELTQNQPHVVQKSVDPD